jgi:hypothetical protein
MDPQRKARMDHVATTPAQETALDRASFHLDRACDLAEVAATCATVQPERARAAGYARDHALACAEAIHAEHFTD